MITVKKVNTDDKMSSEKYENSIIKKYFIRKIYHNKVIYNNGYELTCKEYLELYTHQKPDFAILTDQIT
jgi:hypothetical protein